MAVVELEVFVGETSSLSATVFTVEVDENNFLKFWMLVNCLIAFPQLDLLTNFD